MDQTICLCPTGHFYKRLYELSILVLQLLISDRKYTQRLQMFALLRKFQHDESGATAIEYGLIAALIAVVCITIWRSIGTNMNTKFTAVKNGLQ